jgi:hypothetical protein
LIEQPAATTLLVKQDREGCLISPYTALQAALIILLFNQDSAESDEV